MEAALLWRFHSFGDVVLTTGVAAALGRTVALTVATEDRYRPIYAGLWPEERILSRERLESLGSPAGFVRVIDLQGTPGARRLARRLGSSVRSVRTHAAARRWLVLWGDRFPRPRIPHAVERYAAAAGLDPRDGAQRYAPRVVVAAGEEAEARRRAPAAFAFDAAPVVALAVGASRRTKEIPATTFRVLADLLVADGMRVWWLAPPAPPEAATPPATARGLEPGSRPRGSQEALSGAATWFRLPLGPLKAVLARATLVVSCDSGPMHLAAALGTPVLGLFAGTVPAFGFAPCGDRAGVLEVAHLACRPCGVHGRERCWLGHWRCLRELTPERIAAAVRLRLREASRRTTETGSGHERTPIR